MNFLLADKQDITRAGLMYLIERIPGSHALSVDDKDELVRLLSAAPRSVVVLDYTLFDIDGVAELAILSQRFPSVHWLLFSEDLSQEFVRTLLAAGSRFGVVLKEASLAEINTALVAAADHRRYICQRTAELLLQPLPHAEDAIRLTKTETEILKDIALGLTTKEIAEKRFSSFHTINTHRKNIFRKLQVNNVHEATKYALRAGLIDSAEYYI